MIKVCLDVNTKEMNVEVEYDKDTFTENVITEMVTMCNAILYNVAIKYYSTAPLEVQIKLMNDIKYIVGNMVSDKDADIKLLKLYYYENGKYD